MTKEDIKNITDIVHKTIYEFFDVCGDDEEVPMTDKDKLLLKVNKAICNNIKALSKATPLKTGHWINAKVGKLFPSNDFKCSECGNILGFDGVNCGRGDANFCPNCGAKMESEEQE